MRDRFLLINFYLNAEIDPFVLALQICNILALRANGNNIKVNIFGVIKSAALSEFIRHLSDVHANESRYKHNEESFDPYFTLIDGRVDYYISNSVIPTDELIFEICQFLTQKNPDIKSELTFSKSFKSVSINLIDPNEIIKEDKSLENIYRFTANRIYRLLGSELERMNVIGRVDYALLDKLRVEHVSIE